MKNNIKLSFTTIKSYIETLEQLNSILEKENKQLKKDAVALVSKEILNENEYLKKKLEYSFGEFSSLKEKEMYCEFSKQHEHNRKNLKIQSGKVPYIIQTYTGVGICKEVVCPICGEKQDITDISVW